MIIVNELQRVTSCAVNCKKHVYAFEGIIVAREPLALDICTLHYCTNATNLSSHASVLVSVLYMLIIPGGD